ncbi:uncharacterized protein [Acropora muricata]|uniref:uncharacterized protein isoform X2 n=1 Tax=Acropora muricata TaxID=159855 RepID=UPI0034E3DDDF
MDRSLEHVFMLAKCFMILIGLTVGDQCKQSDVSTPGKALRNHIFKSVTVTGPFECHELCESDLHCHSYNFLIFGKICELNNSTKEARSRDYVTDEARFYMRIWPPIGQSFASCKEILNDPRFNWLPFPFKATFSFSSKLWSNYDTLNILGGRTGFDSQETKLPTYWNTPFTKICLAMKIGHQINFITINRKADSLHSLIADGKYRATTLGRGKWKSLIGTEGSLQLNCNKEGFNPSCTGDNAKARIGIVGNNENVCNTCDSFVGFGGGGYPLYNSITCGNSAVENADNGLKKIKAMGYILVQ